MWIVAQPVDGSPVQDFLRCEVAGDVVVQDRAAGLLAIPCDGFAGIVSALGSPDATLNLNGQLADYKIPGVPAFGIQPDLLFEGDAALGQVDME